MKDVKSKAGGKKMHDIFIVGDNSTGLQEADMWHRRG